MGINNHQSKATVLQILHIMVKKDKAFSGESLNCHCARKFHTYKKRPLKASSYLLPPAEEETAG